MTDGEGLDAADEERLRALEADLRRLEGKLEALYRFLGLREKI